MSTLNEAGRKVYDECSVSLVALGDSGVGKTTFINRAGRLSDFILLHEATIGIDFLSLDLYIEHPTKAACVRKIRTQCWDTAGMEKFTPLQDSYYRRKDIFFLFYAVDDRTSFENIFKKWLPRFLQKRDKEDSLICLIGTKTDLVDGDMPLDGVADSLGDLYDPPTTPTTFVSAKEAEDRCKEEENRYDKLTFFKVTQISNKIMDPNSLQMLLAEVVIEVGGKVSPERLKKPKAPNPLSAQHSPANNRSCCY